MRDGAVGIADRYAVRRDGLSEVFVVAGFDDANGSEGVVGVD